MQEASLHEESCFVTLTYDDDHVPENQGLCIEDYQRFMKRLRRKISPRRVSFFGAGEYGDKLGRPHYHLLLFGWQPPDQKIFKRSDTGNIFTSAFLSAVWKNGFVSVGAVTYSSAAYVARYCIKKITGAEAVGWYGVLDESTGELLERPAEFMTCSKRPGIGKRWFDLYGGDVVRDDFILIDGKKAPVPKYYDKLTSPEKLELAKAERRRARLAPRSIRNRRPDRLAVREEVKRAQISQLKRTLK